MIKASLTLFPWGMLSGLPCIALDVEGQLSTGEAERMGLAIKRLAGRYPGLRRAWIRRAPWSDDAFVEYLGALDELELSVVASQPATAMSWGFSDMDWYVDASSVVADPVSAANVTERLQALPGFPAPAELLVRPLAGNLSPLILDALRFGTNARSGELQVEPEILGIAAATAAQAAPFWRVVVAQPPAPETSLFAV